MIVDKILQGQFKIFKMHKIICLSNLKKKVLLKGCQIKIAKI